MLSSNPAKPAATKTHYDGKSKEPNDQKEIQQFLSAWNRKWLGRKQRRILGRWIARDNETILQGHWNYKVKHTYVLIAQNTGRELDPLIDWTIEYIHLHEQVTREIIDQICSTLFQKINNHKMMRSQWNEKISHQLSGCRTIYAMQILGKEVKGHQMHVQQKWHSQYLQTAIDLHNVGQLEEKAHAQKTKMEMNGVKKPNDIFQSVKRRSVNYYRKQRDKLDKAIQKGYPGKQRLKFLQGLILMNPIMCDELREAASPAYLLHRLEIELGIEISDACYHEESPFFMAQMTEFLDDVTQEIFEYDFENETNMIY